MINDLTTEYQALAQMIRSGQLEHDQVQRVLDADPDFYRWYHAKYLLKDEG